MSLFGLGAGFQTSFVVAVLVAAIFMAQRLGGDQEVLRRGMQVAIAFAMFLTVFSATTAFIRPPDVPSSQFSDGFSEGDDTQNYLDEAAEKASGAGTVHLGMGILLAVAGAYLWKRWTVIPGGLLFGGLLLLLLGAPPAPESEDSLGAYYALAFSVIGRADQLWEIARFGVMLVGSALLLVYAYARLELPDEPPAADEPPPEEPPPMDEMPMMAG